MKEGGRKIKSHERKAEFKRGEKTLRSKFGSRASVYVTSDLRHLRERRPLSAHYVCVFAQVHHSVLLSFLYASALKVLSAPNFPSLSPLIASLSPC